MLIERAKAWIKQDPDPETKAELQALVEANDLVALADRMESRLSFGTAGLRGELGAGPNRMNRVLVAQAAMGIANYILKSNLDANPSIVIGFDGRINSAVFARDSAKIFAAAGFKTLLFDSVVPTPVLAFAGKHLAATAAIMVTASHNPPRDNGYKVYLGGANGGSQIISPTDKEIAAEIKLVADSLTFEEIPKAENFETLGDEMRMAYIGEAAAITGEIENGENLKIVYSAMHGVGWHIVEQLFAAAGLPRPIPVQPQLLPDGNFPTVAFPNPEEPGAMDLSFEVARNNSADLIVVNDPDADRLAIGIPDSTCKEGWRRLTGDEVGLILGDEMASRAVASGQQGTLSCSMVSSSALAKVAAHYKLNFQETLTGFKWIAKVPNLIYGYEEALGYCVDPKHTPDKDGISAALVMIQIASRLAKTHRTLSDHIAELGEKYGHYATGQISIRVTNLETIAKIMERFRLNPPQQIDGIDATFTDIANTDALRFDLANEARVIVRPSGTEPKLKCYLQAVGTDANSANSRLANLRIAMEKLLA